MYSSPSYSFNSLLMMIFSLLFIIIIGSLSIVQYNYVAEDRTDRFYNEITNTNIFLNHSVAVLYEGLKLYDSRYDYEMEMVLKRFSDSYVSSGGNINQLNLSQYKSEFTPYFRGNLDLYIINSDNIIEKSSYLPDIGLNFEQYPVFSEILDSIRNDDRFQADQWVDSVNTPGYYRKYAYLPTPDHRYILEVGLHSEEFTEIRKSVFSYKLLGSKILQINPDLLAVTFFKSNVNEIDEKTEELSERPSVTSFISPEELNSTIRNVYTEKQTEIKENGTLYVEYQYFSARDDLTPSSSEMCIVAVMVYSREKLNRDLQEYLFIHLIITCFALILACIFAMYISRFISQPLEQVISDIEQIARGDYNHQIRKTCGRDVDRLGTSVDLMVRKILADIEDIQKGHMDIANELEWRKAAEQALIIANTKLNNLSSITRHDILNQVTSIRWYAYMVEHADDPDKMHQYMQRIQHQSRLIEDIIAFSRDYQNVGVNASSWQNLGLAIHEGIQSPFGDKVSLDVKDISVDILADSLLQKVFYNLADNSLSHGGPGGEKIHISFVKEQNHGIILYLDEGKGVPDGDKELIFGQGFGAGTGLGLFLIREILSITGMTITETGSYGYGVRFEITVPADQYRDAIPG